MVCLEYLFVQKKERIQSLEGLESTKTCGAEVVKVTAKVKVLLLRFGFNMYKKSINKKITNACIKLVSSLPSVSSKTLYRKAWARRKVRGESNIWVESCLA